MLMENKNQEIFHFLSIISLYVENRIDGYSKDDIMENKKALFSTFLR